MLARSNAQFLTHCDSTRGDQIEKPDLLNLRQIDLIRALKYEIAHRPVRDPVAVAPLRRCSVCSAPCRPQHISPNPRADFVPVHAERFGQRVR